MPKSKHSDYGPKLKRRLVRLGLSDPNRFKGCTDEEIASIMKEQGVTFLPEVYRSFLREMGWHMGGRPLDDLDYNREHLRYIKEYAMDDGPEDLAIPDDAFIFISRHTGEYCYFRTYQQEENPPVYFIHYDDYESQNPILITTKQWDTLTDYFDERIRWICGVYWNPLATGRGFVGNFTAWVKRRIKGIIEERSMDQ